MKICFFTDAPPLSSNAHGNHGIARYLIGILQDEIKLILTTKFRRSINKKSILEACGTTPKIIYPDASGAGLRRFLPRLASLLDIMLFILWLPVIHQALKKEKIESIFVLCGADAWVLPKVWLLQMFCIPMQIYLVDDMEGAAVKAKGHLPQSVISPLLRSVLARSSKVFAISEGFSEHLSNRFGCKALWLPLPSLLKPPSENHSQNIEKNPERIVYIGALNHLYIDAIRDLYEEICIHNASSEYKKIILEIITYSNPEPFIASLTNRDWVIGQRNIPDEELRKKLMSATACLLPYSFHPTERLMVSTSFSCKILEYYASGRLILVYGPDYASIPRFFKEHGLPLCATNKEELRIALNDITSFEISVALKKYTDVWKKYHSPKAIREIVIKK